MKRPVALLFLALLIVPAETFSASRTLHRSWLFPSRNGKRIVVDTSDMDVQLRVGDVQEILVTVEAHISNVTERQAEEWLVTHDPKLDDSDETLRIETSRGPKGILGHLTARARLSIVAPTSVIPDLATLSGDLGVRGDFPNAAPLRLATMTGDIDFLGAAHSLTAIATSGKVAIVVVRPLEELIVRTTSGRVKLSGGARKASVDTASGSITLMSLSGSCQVSTSSGSVDLAWDRLDPEHRVVVRSIRGAVDLNIPPGVAPSGTLRTVKGKIESRLSGTLNGDGTVFELRGDGPHMDVETTKARIVLEVLHPGETTGSSTPATTPSPTAIPTP